MAAPSSDEQLRAVETLIVHYERLLSEIQAASRDWERIFDAIEDPICVVAADYRLVATNAAYRRTFGPVYLRGGQHYCFMSTANNHDGHPAGPCMDCPLPETVRTGCPGFVRQVWQSSGESGEPSGLGTSPPPRVYQRWTYPIVAADGTVDRVVEVIKDVSEQEQVCRSATETEALREADRLKAELLGTVSHELRSPLTVIKGYAATLLRHERRLPREERQEFLEAIGEASDRLEVIVNRLLEMSQLETGGIVPQLAPLDVTQVAQEAITNAEQQAQVRAPGRHKHLFRLHLPPEHGRPERVLPLIDADHRLLRDALDNLLENAVKYSPAGGWIDVTLGISAAPDAPDASAAIGEGTTSRVHSEVHPQMLEIVVRDPGLGIPAEHLGRVFERFHRVDTRLTREVDGLGLGLAMCKRVAELHGGAIWAESAPGEGSAFHLLLPLVAARTSSGKSLPIS